MINDSDSDTIYEIFKNPQKFSRQDIEVYLISWEKNRVWWGDLECDVHPDGIVYELMLEGWSKISRGSFLPKNILEKWNKETGLIELSFNLNEEECQIELQYTDDWMDVSLIDKINHLIHRSGYQFESLTIVDQGLCLVVLRIDEKQRLQQERQLNFN